MRILIMGLPGSGKTTLAKELQKKLNAVWFNADDVRKQYNDWDFTIEGRLRQAKRLKDLADRSTEQYTICDFVCPLPEMRTIFNADFTIWMDTITSGRYKDTNKMFVVPEKYDIRVTEMDCERWLDIIINKILNT